MDAAVKLHIPKLKTHPFPYIVKLVKALEVAGANVPLLHEVHIVGVYVVTLAGRPPCKTNTLYAAAMKPLAALAVERTCTEEPHPEPHLSFAMCKARTAPTETREHGVFCDIWADSLFSSDFWDMIGNVPDTRGEFCQWCEALLESFAEEPMPEVESDSAGFLPLFHACTRVLRGLRGVLSSALGVSTLDGVRFVFPGNATQAEIMTLVPKHGRALVGALRRDRSGWWQTAYQ